MTIKQQDITKLIANNNSDMIAKSQKFFHLRLYRSQVHWSVPLYLTQNYGHGGKHVIGHIHWPANWTRAGFKTKDRSGLL